MHVRAAKIICSLDWLTTQVCELSTVIPNYSLKLKYVIKIPKYDTNMGDELGLFWTSHFRGIFRLLF